MKRIVFFIAALFSIFISSAQEYGKDTKYGTEANRTLSKYTIGFPKDTFAIPFQYQSYNHVAFKNGMMYVYQPTLNAWQAYAGGGTGITEVFAAYGLTNSDYQTLKVDTALLFAAFRSTLDPGTDVSSKLNISDTMSMLANYVRLVDVYTKSQVDSRLALKLAISDSANMMLPYIRDRMYGIIRTGRALGLDTAVVYPYIRSVASSGGGGGSDPTKLPISDTAAMLAPYETTADNISRLLLKLNIADSSSMLNPYIRDRAYGLLRMGRALAVDTAVLFPAIRSTIPGGGGGSDPSKLNVSDTTAMLSPYETSADAIARDLLNLLKSDTTSMLAPYDRRADALAREALKLSTIDTSNMLLPYETTADVIARIGAIPGAQQVVFNNVAAMLAVRPADSTGVRTLGYYAAGDGGGAFYKYNSASTATADGGGYLAPTVGSGPGRYELQHDGTIFTPWWGVKSDGVTDNTARLQAAIDYWLNNLRAWDLVLQGGAIGIGTGGAGVTIGTNTAGDGNLSAKRMRGEGKNSSGGTANAGGTDIVALGSVPYMMQLNQSAYRYLRFEDFSLDGVKTDLATVGFNMFTSNSSQLRFKNINFAYQTYSFKLNRNGSANAEFMIFDNCFWGGTHSGFWSDAFQALTTSFINCGGTVQYGGTMYNLTEQAGANIINPKASFNAGFTWAASTAVTDQRSYYRSGGSMYRLVTPGTTGSTMLSGTGTGITNGTAVFDYVRPVTGTTFIAAGGNQPDVIGITDGRLEGVSTLVKFLTSGVNMSVSIDRLNVTLNGSDTTDYPFLSYEGNATGSMNFNKLQVYDATALTSGKKIVINTGTSTNAEVTIKNPFFGGVIPSIKSSAESRQKPASASNQSINFTRVAIEDARETRTTGTAYKTSFYTQIFDNSPKNVPMVKQENYLLESDFGTTTGSNVAASSPWVHNGSTSTFAFKNRMTTGTQSLVSDYSVNVRINPNSYVYQDIPQFNLTAANAGGYSMKFNYEGVVNIWGNLGTLWIGLVNSVDTNYVYRSIELSANGNQDYKPFTISLEGTSLVSQTGYVRLVIKNIGTGSLNLNVFKQFVYQNQRAAFVMARQTAVSKTQMYDHQLGSTKVNGRFQINTGSPSIYGSASLPELQGDVFISDDTTTNATMGLRFFDGLRWNTVNGIGEGTSAPTTGWYKRNFLIRNTNPSSNGIWAWINYTDGVDFRPMYTAGATPGGVNNQFQFNSSGSFAGASNLITDGTRIYMSGGWISGDYASNTNNFMRFQTGGRTSLIATENGVDKVGIVMGGTVNFGDGRGISFRDYIKQRYTGGIDSAGHWYLGGNSNANYSLKVEYRMGGVGVKIDSLGIISSPSLAGGGGNKVLLGNLAGEITPSPMATFIQPSDTAFMLTQYPRVAGLGLLKFPQEFRLDTNYVNQMQRNAFATTNGYGILKTGAIFGLDSATVYTYARSLRQWRDSASAGNILLYNRSIKLRDTLFARVAVLETNTADNQYALIARNTFPGAYKTARFEAQNNIQIETNLTNGSSSGFMSYVYFDGGVHKNSTGYDRTGATNGKIFIVDLRNGTQANYEVNGVTYGGMYNFGTKLKFYFGAPTTFERDLGQLHQVNGSGRYTDSLIADNGIYLNNAFKYTDGNQASGKVLTSDASGNATWQTPSGGGGGSGVTSLNGNTGALTMDTTYLANFHLKVKSLFSAGAGLSYNATTGVFTNTGVTSISGSGAVGVLPVGGLYIISVDNSSSTTRGTISAEQYNRLYTKQVLTNPTGTMTVDIDAGSQVDVSFTSSGARTLAYSNIGLADIVKMNFVNTSGAPIVLTLPGSSGTMRVAGIGLTNTVTIPTGYCELTLTNRTSITGTPLSYYNFITY